MSSQLKKILVLLAFLVIFVGSALFMYFKFIHNKPKMRFDQHRTEVNPKQFDSILYEQNKQKTLK